MRLVLGAVFVAAVGSGMAPDAAGAELRRSGFLGVGVAPIQESGVVVSGLVEGGSAREAGVRERDVILSLDGRGMRDVPAFVAAAKALRAGDVATLEVRRDGAPVEIRVPVKPRPLEHEEGMTTVYSAVAVDGHLRRVLLTVPPGEARHPAVLFATGIGCFSQEISDRGDTVAQFLHGLTRAGFVTMRVEKSSMGDSEGPPCMSPQADFHAEVRGYVAGLKALKADPRVDPANVFVAGLSIGGVEAPLIAKEESVRGLVVINTVGRNFLEYLLETRRRQMRLAHVPFDRLEDRMVRVADCNRKLLADRMAPEALVARQPECAEEIRYPAPATYMQQWASLNLGEAWLATDTPALVVAGSSDYVATVEDAPLLDEMLNASRPGRSTLAIIEGMDHTLSKAASMRESQSRSGRPGEFEPKVLEVTTRWMAGKVS